MFEQSSVRINFDAAVRGSYAVIACCFRKFNGQLLGLSTTKIPHLDSDVAEAHAAKLAIAVALERGWRSILIEGD